MLVLPDGEDMASEAKLAEAAEAVRRAGVPAYAIGIELPRRPPRERHRGAALALGPGGLHSRG